MSKILFISLFIVTAFLLSANDFTGIFENYESGVVYVEQALYLDYTDIVKKKTITEYENRLGFSIADVYYTIGSGTGFFVSHDGYILTNNHVITQVNIKQKMITQAIMSSLLYQDRDNKNLTSGMYRIIQEEIEDIVAVSDISLRVTVNNTDKYDADLIQTSPDIDVALLKIEKDNCKTIPPGDSDNVKVGNPVMALGYPVPQDLGYFLDDFKSTMTTGNVSSMRTDNWGIQHTAAVSPGNSGGPLFDTAGNVIGINVGLSLRGNEIYFSIPINKALDWLKEQGLYDKISFAKTNDAAVINTTSYNETDQTGPMLLIDTEAGSEILVNDRKYGKTPMLIKDLKPGEAVIKVQNEDGVAIKKFTVLQSIKTVTTYRPEFKPYTGSVFISSTPSKAKIYLDEKYYGDTPLALNDINPGKHVITAKLDGYAFYSGEIRVKKEQVTEKSVTLQKGYLVTFDTALPDDCKIMFRSTKNEVPIIYEKKTWLENGTYHFTLESSSFLNETESGEFTVDGEDLVLNVTYPLKRSKIVIPGLKKESQVFLDEIDITKSLVENSYETEIGKHSIKIKTSNYHTISEMVMVQDDQPYIFRFTYTRSFEKFKKSYKPVGVGLVVPGGLIMIPGILMSSISTAVFYLNYQDASRFNDYNAYLYMKQQLNGIFSAGLALGLTGLVMVAVSIPLFVIKTPRGKTKGVKDAMKMSLNFYSKPDMSLAVCFSF